MARSHAVLLTSIWTNPEFIALRADAQRAYMMLISQPDLTVCGTLPLNTKRLARLADDTTQPRIVKAISQLESAGFVVIDHDTDEIAIRTFLRHDRVIDQPNVLKAASRAFATIHSPKLRQIVIDQLPLAVRRVWPDRIQRLSATEVSALTRAKGSTDDTGTLPPDTSGTLPDDTAEPFAAHTVNGSSRTRARGDARVPPDTGHLPPPPDPSPSTGHPDPAAQRTERPTSTRTKRAAAAAEEEAATHHHPDTTHAACALLARRALAGRSGPPIGNRDAWLTDVTTKRLAEHRTAAARHLATHPDLTADQLADLLEPPAGDDEDAYWAEIAEITRLDAERSARQEAEAAKFTPAERAKKLAEIQARLPRGAHPA